MKSVTFHISAGGRRFTETAEVDGAFQFHSTGKAFVERYRELYPAPTRVTALLQERIEGDQRGIDAISLDLRRA